MPYVCRSRCPMSVEITDMTNCTLTDQVTIKYLPIQPLFKVCHLDVNSQCSLFINSKFLDFQMIFHFQILDIKSIIFREARVFGKKSAQQILSHPLCQAFRDIQKARWNKAFYYIEMDFSIPGEKQTNQNKADTAAVISISFKEKLFQGCFRHQGFQHDRTKDFHIQINKL